MVAANVADLVEMHRKYLEEVNSKWKYPPISNLDRYLSTLSGDINCFIVLDNFRNININPGKIPVILRSPVPLVQTFVLEGKHHWRIILGSSAFRLQNISVPANDVDLPCSVSKYLTSLEASRIYDDFRIQHWCLVINHKEYFMRAKPPNCNAHMGIFPSDYVNMHRYLLVYPEIFNFVSKSSPSRFYRIHSAPIFNIIITFHDDKSDFIVELNVVEKWIKATKVLHLSYAQQNIFIALQVEGLGTSSTWLQSNGCISSAIIFKICYPCKIENTTKYGTIIQTELKILDPSEVARHAYPSAEENMVWVIHDYSNTNTLLSLMLLHSRTCNSKPSRRSCGGNFFSVLTTCEACNCSLFCVEVRHAEFHTGSYE